MRVNVFASSPIGLWAALRLQEKSYEIDIKLLSNPSEALRPIRIQRGLLSDIISRLGKLGIPVSNILEAPVVRGWISPSGESFDRIWTERHSHEERWIDSARLRESLLRACELEGIPVQIVDRFPVPDWNQGADLGIYEAEPQEASHWSKAFLASSDRMCYETTEILFPRGMDSALQRVIFFDFDGVKATIENLNRQKSVLTLISRSRVLINRTLEDLRTKLSERETGQLRALFALNPHVFRRDSKHLVGESGLYIPQFCLLSQGFGGLPPLMNTQLREGFKQITRLEEHLGKAKKASLSDPVRIAEEWYQAEKRGFLRLLAWQQGWEDWLWSRMRQSWVLRVQQILPGKIRELLKSPL